MSEHKFTIPSSTFYLQVKYDCPECGKTTELKSITLTCDHKGHEEEFKKRMIKDKSDE